MKKEDLCALIQRELNEETEIKPETNFKETQNYGSLSAVLILQLVEDKFGVKVNPRSFRKINTVNDLVDAIGADKFEN